MSKPMRRPQRLYSLVMWLLSIIFAGFFIGLGSLIIADLPRVEERPSLEEFVDPARRATLEDEIASLNTRLSELREARVDDMQDIASAQADLAAAEDAFQTWLANRSVTESADQNPDVVRRTEAVEAFRIALRAEEAELEETDRAITDANRALRSENMALNTLRAEARPQFERAMNALELRVFLFRLALTLPLLVIAFWLVAKKRESGYWPLYRGFVLFASFAFFVELVPYLPSYGGYVRYGVGIILVAIAGHFIIRAMKRYLEKQKESEARSEVERRKAISYETALKKLEAKTCPGCDRALHIKDGVPCDFCVHCGIRLHDNCPECGTYKITFHHFCMACGHDCRTDTPQPPEQEEQPRAEDVPPSFPSPS